MEGGKERGMGGISWELEMKEKIFKLHDSVIMLRTFIVPKILMWKYTVCYSGQWKVYKWKVIVVKATPLFTESTIYF